jgi:hypothetical protein
MEDMASRKSPVRTLGCLRANRANAQKSGRGVVPGARLGGLTSKAGMSFSFMEIMLATLRSVKDSDCGLAAGRPGVLGATISLLDPARRHKR